MKLSKLLEQEESPQIFKQAEFDDFDSLLDRMRTHDIYKVITKIYDMNDSELMKKFVRTGIQRIDFNHDVDTVGYGNNVPAIIFVLCCLARNKDIDLKFINMMLDDYDINKMFRLYGHKMTLLGFFKHEKESPFVNNIVKILKERDGIAIFTD